MLFQMRAEVDYIYADGTPALHLVKFSVKAVSRNHALKKAQVIAEQLPIYADRVWAGMKTGLAVEILSET